MSLLSPEPPIADGPLLSPEMQAAREAYFGEGGIASWERTIRNASAENKLRVFGAKAREAFDLARRAGLGEIHTADTLQTIAETHGLVGQYGQDAVQTALAEARKISASRPASGLLLTTADFLNGFVPPDYLIDGLLQRRFLYSLTAPTGTGKTAIALRIAAHVDQGLPLAGREIDRGRTLFLAGENPDDVRMRWTKTLEEMSIDPAKCNVVFRPGSFNLNDPAVRKQIATETDQLGPFALVIVDTSAAFFSGDDENNNAQMGGHARTLRGLVDIKGGPTVLATCHPTKSPNNDNLLPRGGGAFLNEVDGNLICQKQADSKIVEMHWHGKFRGPDFAPIPFSLTVGKTPALVDSKGRALSVVTARSIGQIEVDEADVAARHRQDSLLDALRESPGASLSELAKTVGWAYANGDPNKTLVNRTLNALKAANLIKKDGRGWKVVKVTAVKVTAEKPKKDRFTPEMAEALN